MAADLARRPAAAAEQRKQEAQARAEKIQRTIDAWPPLTDAQLDRLYLLFHPGEVADA